MYKACTVIKIDLMQDKTVEVTARTAGISKAWPFPLPESYPSSNDSLTIGVPGPSIYGSVGSGIPHYPGTTQSIWGNPRGNLKAQPSPLHDRLYPGVASTSGRYFLRLLTHEDNTFSPLGYLP